MISSPGIGSGLDINSLVSQLVAAEAEAPGLRLAQREADTQARISAFGSLKGSLSAFGDATSVLSKLATFESRATLSTDLTVLNASAENNAAIASYNIEVVNLAASHKLASTGFASAAAAVGSGSITISSGGSVSSVVVGSGANTLADVRDAINSASQDTGVTATIINVDDGSGGTESRLLLSADNTGLANVITVTVDDDDGNDTDTAGLSQLVYDPVPGSGVTNLNEAQAAVDALIKIDNQAVSSASNTIVDALEGVTINLVSAAPGSPVSLGVSRDSNVVNGQISDFVKTFNTLQKSIAELSKFDAETGARGVLLGSATLLTVSNQIRRELTDAVIGVNGNFRTLSDLGIRTELDGTLSIDSTLLDAALASDPQAVSDVFTSFDGIAVRLDVVVQNILASDGSIDTNIDGLNATLKDIAEQRDRLSVSLGNLESRLLAQFTAMDALVGQLQATSNFLTQQLSILQATFVSNQN